MKIPKNCPLSKRSLLYVVLHDECIYPNNERKRDFDTDYQFGLIDFKNTRAMCIKCPLRKFWLQSFNSSNFIDDDII